MMVTKWGMSDKVGLVYIDEKETQSGDFQGLIDAEVSTYTTGSLSISLLLSLYFIIAHSFNGFVFIIVLPSFFPLFTMSLSYYRPSLFV